MNYRHIYHAGNFADIFKHLILSMVLDYLQNKDKGMFMLDAFGGCGLYDLNSDAAQRTLEYQQGVESFMKIDFPNEDLRNFQAILKPYLAKNLYPGSPLLMAAKLRPQDRLSANELHPEDIKVLRKTLAGYHNAKALQMDAYDSIRANVPPNERRGLVLIDPPFERKDEFQVLADQITEWTIRWPTGCYMIWYPIKAGSNLDEMIFAAQDSGMKRIWMSEFLIHPRNTPESFNGCGVMIFNTPFQIPERVEAFADSLCPALGGREITTHWLTEE